MRKTRAERGEADEGSTFRRCSQLKKIDAPHRRIHLRGAEALACAARGEHDRARAISRDIRERELAGTLALFAETRMALRDAHREVAVVTQAGGRQMAVAVDGIEAVEHLKETDSDRLEAYVPEFSGGLVSSIRKRARDEQLVMVVAPSRVMAA